MWSDGLVPELVDAQFGEGSSNALPEGGGEDRLLVVVLWVVLFSVNFNSHASLQMHVFTCK